MGGSVSVFVYQRGGPIADTWRPADVDDDEGGRGGGIEGGVDDGKQETRETARPWTAAQRRGRLVRGLQRARQTELVQRNAE